MATRRRTRRVVIGPLGDLPPEVQRRMDHDYEVHRDRTRGHPLGQGADHDEEHYQAHESDDGLGAYRGAPRRGHVPGKESG